MLVELAVTNLGVIAEARIPLAEGLNALTGETGAGKTMIVEALNLLSGGKADASRVRSGETEAVVEGLFVNGDDEWVVRRVVPAAGRSRAYINGRLSASSELAELGGELIELHGQHAQQSLLQPRHQRDALDRFAGVDRQELNAARRALGDALERLDSLGGDEAARAREIDLLRFQLDEIDAVNPLPGEEDQLEVEADRLARAVEYRAAGAAALAALAADGAATDMLATSSAHLGGHAPYAAVTERLGSLHAELADVAAELRSVLEGIEPDEERLAEIGERRAALGSLRRKYGPTAEGVLSFAAEARERLAALEDHDEVVSAAEAAVAACRLKLAEVGARLGAARRAAAGRLAEAVVAQLGGLALPGSRVLMEIDDTDDAPGAGEAVQFLLATNAGLSPGPLSRVASGGELSRVMLALRLVLSGGPPTMVFDEVDAGVGGEAASAVGRSLADLAEDHQVIVVTHLPQVAAFADHQIAVVKEQATDATRTVAATLGPDERVIELSRMLSGSPDSATARHHAEELLATAAGRRRKSR